MLEIDGVSDNQGMTVTFKTHFVRTRRGKTLEEGEAPPNPEPVLVGRTPRITKLLALAIHLQKFINSGALCDYSQIAAITGLTRARITQIMNLNLLAPGIQEDILFMPKIFKGVDPISERNLRDIALHPRWDMQLKLWNALVQKNTLIHTN